MIIWTSKSWEEFVYIYEHDQRLVKRVIKLIKDIERSSYSGIGKPEPLRGDLFGYWSRRIDSKNRIVYKMESGCVKIVQCGTHYGDK